MSDTDMDMCYETCSTAMAACYAMSDTVCYAMSDTDLGTCGGQARRQRALTWLPSLRRWPVRYRDSPN
eukprot:466981-Rhodomonas_salina.5